MGGEGYKNIYSLFRQQAMEMHKRKAIESAQSAADLKLHLEKYHSQIKVHFNRQSMPFLAYEGTANIKVN